MRGGGCHLPGRPRFTAQTPIVSSMCMEIAGFTHDDCPGGTCTCKCHDGEAVSS